MRISVLDQSGVAEGRSPHAAIRDSLALARLAERLGYHRYWLAEHHNSASVAGSAPEVLMAAIAATTTRIRIGSAGIMLPHYAPLKVAEQFRVLEAIAPGRIDMGLGRAPGSDGLTAHALNPNAGRAAEHFPADVRDLLDWVGGEALVEGHPFRGVTAQPAGPGAPEAWILGSSDYGAQVAAHFGLPYCFAWFITDGEGAEQAFDTYRAGYRPSLRHPQPHAAICVWAVAADTEAEAAHLFASRALARVWRDRGIHAPLPAPEAAGQLDAPDRARLDRHMARGLFGAAPALATRLSRLAATCGADEIAILTATHAPEARRHSYELLAAAFGLTPDQ